jgi:uncharacterized lipoprotein YehR (DUF1307 family)
LKTFATALSALALALSIASCGSDEKKPAPSPQTPARITPAPSVTPGPQSKPEVKHDFRAADWGMSKDEVKKTERRKLEHEDENSLTYSGYYNKLYTYITYQFKDDKLFRAGVIYPQKLESDNLYLENYEKLKSDIIKAYGAPVIDGEKQLNPGAVIEPDKKAEAVCRGDLMYGAQWSVPGSMVVLMIRGDNKECLVSLIYTDESVLRPIAEQDGSGIIGIPE